MDSEVRGDVGANGAKPSFSWLHLSDLHVGQTGQDWLWPTLKTAFYADISKLFDLAGPWDVVIFSGDLTQKGTAQEFLALDRVLSEIWEKFDKLSIRPPLFAVPGNHDLVRPRSDDPVAIALRKCWWTEPQIREALCTDENGTYRRFVFQAFEKFSEWWTRLPSKGIPTPTPQRSGILPGDISCQIVKAGSTFGLVGLNSAYLQLAPGEAKGTLALNAQQLLALTEGSPDDWCRRNNANLVVTHHPIEWLHD